MLNNSWCERRRRKARIRRPRAIYTPSIFGYVRPWMNTVTRTVPQPQACAKCVRLTQNSPELLHPYAGLSANSRPNWTSWRRPHLRPGLTRISANLQRWTRLSKNSQTRTARSNCVGKKSLSNCDPAATISLRKTAPRPKRSCGISNPNSSRLPASSGNQTVSVTKLSLRRKLVAPALSKTRLIRPPPRTPTTWSRKATPRRRLNCAPNKTTAVRLNGSTL